MKHSIPPPPDEETSNQDDLLNTPMPPTSAEVAAKRAFMEWLTPENIDKFMNQSVVFTARGLVASGATAAIAREVATQKGYGYSDAFVFHVYPGLRREMGYEEPQGIIARIGKKLRNFLP